jgi:hypothetical protein
VFDFLGETLHIFLLFFNLLVLVPDNSVISLDDLLLPRYLVVKPFHLLIEVVALLHHHACNPNVLSLSPIDLESIVFHYIVLTFYCLILKQLELELILFFDDQLLVINLFNLEPHFLTLFFEHNLEIFKLIFSESASSLL